MSCNWDNKDKVNVTNPKVSMLIVGFAREAFRLISVSGCVYKHCRLYKEVLFFDTGKMSYTQETLK